MEEINYQNNKKSRTKTPMKSDLRKKYEKLTADLDKAHSEMFHLDMERRRIVDEMRKELRDQDKKLLYLVRKALRGTDWEREHSCYSYCSPATSEVMGTVTVFRKVEGGGKVSISMEFPPEAEGAQIIHLREMVRA